MVYQVDRRRQHEDKELRSKLESLQDRLLCNVLILNQQTTQLDRQHIRVYPYPKLLVKRAICMAYNRSH